MPEQSGIVVAFPAAVSDIPQRVLVVDDDETIRLMVERILRREQFQVDCARDGFEAIEKLARHDYSTILLDLMMPRVDGLGVLRYLTGNRSQSTPSVILMTANLEVGDAATQAAPVFGMLAKPFDIQELITQVRESGVSHRASN